MSQTWNDDTYASGHTGSTDLQNIENNLICLKSLFSGGSAPSNAVAGMPWFDTTQKVLKYRNNANNAWLGVLHGDSSQKIMVYRNTAMDGYAIDSSITDRVIAVKGGSTYTAGGATAGTWTQPNHTHTLATHRHTISSDGGHTHPTEGVNGYNDGGASSFGNDSGSAGAHSHTGYAGYSGVLTTANGASVGWRPAAAVVTIQYLDL